VDKNTQLQKIKQAFRDQANATKNSNKNNKPESTSGRVLDSPKRSAAAFSMLVSGQPNNPSILHNNIANYAL
jgi:hypothetical protein